ncbi:hypothetical protein Fmac_014745 [Flemingia macrophylla]|uniref:HpcH/HpaI aldolase/citrate lyase domain-containing protein n=1 Tax=Flemingia macrophylla TaxID=520843 RepID=A0ABD1MCQ1_9FABA
MCQVESHNNVRNASKITAMDNVDYVQIGPLDISASLDYLWDPGNRRVREVLREAERKALEPSVFTNYYALKTFNTSLFHEASKTESFNLGHQVEGTN